VGDSEFDNFEQAMRQMGVRRLGDKPVRRPAAVRAEAKAVPETPAVKPDNPTVLAPASPSEEAQLTVELSEAQDQILALKRQLVDLQVENQALAAPVAAPRSGRIQRILRERGLDVNQHEPCFRALMEAGTFSRFLDQIEVLDETSFARFLDGQIFLHCGQSGCEGPASMASVPVSPEACEICGGLACEPWAEKLSSQLLLNGVRKLYFRGQRVALLRWFSAQMDPRITIRVAPVDVNLSLGAEVGPVVLWRQGNEAQGTPAEIRIKAGSLAQFVKRLCYKLDED
jgi:hypothetical protein